MDTVNDIFVVLIPGLLIAIATSFITVRLSLRRFYSERWWEKKAEAYSAIIESLYSMKSYLEAYRDEVAQGRDFNKATQKQLKEKAIEGRDQVFRAAAIGSFLISEEAAASMSLLRDVIRKDMSQGSLLTELDEHAAIVTRLLGQVQDIAKKDLKVE